MLLAGAPAWAAPKISVEAPNNAALGVPFTVRARAQGPDGASIALNVVRASTSSFAILSVAEKQGGLFEVTALPLDLGSQSLALVWTFTQTGAEPQSLSTPVALTVSEPETLKADPELRDIKPPRRARPRWWPWLLALAALAAALEAWRRRRGTPLPDIFTPLPSDTRTPEQRALDELAALAAAPLWAEGRHKDFYLALTDILRRYLEARGQAPATRLTTRELLKALKQEGRPREILAVFKDLFERADLVKFARVRARDAWQGEDLAAARRLVGAP